MHYQSDSARQAAGQVRGGETPPPVVRERMVYVPVPEDVNEKAWRRAKLMLAGDPRVIPTLDKLERIKDLVLSGHPNGEGL